jgi:alpha-mannosidase
MSGPIRHAIPVLRLVLIIVFVMLYRGNALAQTPAQTDSALAALSPQSRAAIEQLASLRALPEGEWRFHVGDLPHGEAIDLDDAAWDVRKPGSTAPAETVWYRRLIEIPANLNGYDITASRIWFSFQADVNGPMTQIVYFNGRRVAMGEELEPVILCEACKPGEKILVAVKLLKTVDIKVFTGVSLPMEPPAERPRPEDLRQELLSAAILAPTLGETPAKRDSFIRAIDAAAEAIDLAALRNGNSQQFDASLRKASQVLSTIDPALRQTTYHLTGNSHIDAAWLWPWTESIDSIRHTWGTALQLMNEYPNYTFTQSAAQYNVWMAEKYPFLNDEIKQRIREGRWEIVGGMWVEPDLNLPDGESLVRQLLIGKRAFRELYGVDVRIGWNPDSFGYNWQLPQIYKRSGIDYFVTQKMAWNDTNQLPLKLFWWQSPDGSKVLTYFPHNYDNDNFDPARLASDLAEARSRAPGLSELMDLYGVGDHGGGATRYTLDQADHWRQAGKIVPNFRMGTAQSFFDDVEPKIEAQSPIWNYVSLSKGGSLLSPPAEGKIRIPTWNDELYFEYHRGVFTSQAAHKKGMRDSEREILDAEKYAALSSLNGNRYPHELLDQAWKKLLFNQFHDLAAGSGIGVIYKDAQTDFEEVHRDTREVASAALNDIQARVDTRVEKGVPVLIFNSLSWARTGIVRLKLELPEPVTGDLYVLDGAGEVLPSQIVSRDSGTNSVQLLVSARNVPSVGYEVVRVVAGDRQFPSHLRTHDLTIENAALRVVVDPKTGCLTSVYEKKDKHESLAEGACGNELIAFKDTPKAYDAWNIDSDFDQVYSRIHSADSVQLLESNRFRAVIRVKRHWQSSHFIQDYILYANSDTVDVENEIDWHENHVLLKAAFALSASSDHATYEIPYGTIDRPTTRNNSWEKAKFEVPALRWADLGDATNGFSLLNDSQYGYDAAGNVLRITLLRSPTWPDPNADRGVQRIRYQIYPHAGSWKEAMTIRRGYEFNYALQALQVPTHIGSLPPSHSFLGINNSNVILTAVKRSEDDRSLILRCYEWAGLDSTVTLAIPAGAEAATRANLMEQADSTPILLSNNEVRFEIRPFEIATVRVEYPASPRNSD